MIGTATIVQKCTPLTFTLSIQVNCFAFKNL